MCVESMQYFKYTHALSDIFGAPRLRQKLHFVHWNEEGWKTGLCAVPPVGQVCSDMQLSSVQLLAGYLPCIAIFAVNTGQQHLLSISTT